MSKSAQENISTKIIPSMSSRQQILYLMNKTQNTESWDMDDNPEDELLDYHKYFLEQREKKRNNMPKPVLQERQRLLKQSLKEFTLIKKNIYIDRKKYPFLEDHAMICSCEKPKKKGQNEDELFGCSKTCLNKMVSTECVETICPSGKACRNRRFQLHQYAEVYPFKTCDRGWGLCAGEFLPKGSFVIQYIGEIYSIDSEYGQMKLKEYRNKSSTYLMSISSKNEVIDPTEKGNLARFINHSCEPNCETQKWHVLSEVCVGIFTLRDIQEGEELTFNYGFDKFKTTFQKCLCGAFACKGYLGLVQSEVVKEKIQCDSCKQVPKTNEAVIVCDKCKRIFHRNCFKNYKDNICHHCLNPEIPNISNLSINKSKKSSQQLIKELKKKKEDTHKNDFLNEVSMVLSSKIEEKKSVFNFEEEIIIDETIELDDSQLSRIRKNVRILSNIGARLFWENNQSTNELKITGTRPQIEKVKELIKKILEERDTSDGLHSVSINVPKIFVRKIIGHQNRNLNSYKAKYNIEIEYDSNLITDEIFPIYDISTIIIKGRENNVKIVENEINKFLLNLKVFTIYLMSTDYAYVKANICQLKTLIDPADLRLRKKELKTDKEIKHSFYYIPSYSRDLVIIGFENELNNGEKLIREFLLRQNALDYNYSLCFLCPTYLLNSVMNFKNENSNMFKTKNIIFRIYDPNFIRKHLNIYIEGKWKDIVETKNTLYKYFSQLSWLNQKKRFSIEEFQQYAYNQEHKLISKNLRKFFVENFPIKNWDLISEEINNTEMENEFLKKFLQKPDKDSILNYSLHLPPGSYSNVFGLNKYDYVKSLCNYVEEALESYNVNKKQLEDRTNIINTTCMANTIEPTHEKEFLTPEMEIEVNSHKEPCENKEPINNINNLINNNFSTTIDDIQNTLLNKLNEIRNEEKIEDDTIPSYNKIYEFKMSKDEINKVISQPNTYNNNYQNVNYPNYPSIFENNQEMNISYNFSNINQMNININISNFKNDMKKTEQEDSFIRRKRRTSPKTFNIENDENNIFYKKYSNKEDYSKNRFQMNKYKKTIDDSKSKSRSISRYRKRKRKYSFSKSKSPDKDSISEINNVNFGTDKPFFKKNPHKHNLDRFKPRNFSLYKNNIHKNFDDTNFHRKNYFNNYKNKYYNRNIYRKNKCNSFRSRSVSSSISNSKLKEFINLRNNDYDDEKDHNYDVIELKSNLKKP